MKISRLRLLPLLGVLAGGLALAGARGSSPEPKPSPSGPPATEAAGWKDVERLASDQKLEAAVELVGRLRAAAREADDRPEWTRALVREVQLRSALHGYETAVRFLRDQPWPDDLLSRAALNLYYGRSLVRYVQAYSWEVSQRERVEAKGAVDLKAWTKDQIAAEALRAYGEVWRDREALGALPLGRLAEHLTPNTYPERIRGTLRDAVSYLTVEILADSSLWRPQQASDTFRLPVAELLKDGVATQRIDDGSVHPLERLTFVLDDLETWHRQRGETEAALEARLTRARQLHGALSQVADRAAIARDLRERLAHLGEVEWWSMGMSVLAGFVRGESAPDALARSRAIAQQGLDAYPKSPGGQACLSLVKSIEAPDYQLVAMTADGARRRSLEVSHRNLATLYFRAWPVDLLQRVETTRDYDLLPAWDRREKILPTAPLVRWTVSLPPTPDFRSHRTSVVPPLDQPGLYVIAASAREDFAPQGNRIAAVNLVVGDLVLQGRSLPGALEVTALSGDTGRFVEGAEVWLYRYDWQKGHRRIATRTTGSDGLARFDRSETTQSGALFVLARHGADLALDPSYVSISSGNPPGVRSASLVYTDRSVYRPQQKLYWKVVAWRGGGLSGRFEVAPGASLSVSLVDPNRQTVETRTIATNTFGSASGEFTIPAGRPLGTWRVQTSWSGSTPVRVEEYKRPTFEVAFRDPDSPLRLNRPARLTGTATYYFGLPLATGQVTWRVTRQALYPWWWDSCFWVPPAPAQIVASGSTALQEDGTFEVAFTPEADERKATPELTYSYAISADVTDEGGETRSADRAVRLGFVAVEATLTPPTAFLRAGQPGDLVARRTSLDGAPRPGGGSWRVVALRQPPRALLPADQPLPQDPRPGHEPGYQTPGDAVRPRWEGRYSAEAFLRQWEDGDEKGSGSLVHDAEGEASIRLPALAAGAYRVHYETKDEFGARYATARELLVVGNRGAELALPALLLAERSSVPVGETARFFALSGLPGQSMVVEVYRGGRRRERRVVPPGRAGTLLEFPIGPADRGGFGVTLSVLRDHQALTSSQSVFVPWDDRQLKLEFATFRDRMRPKTRETWRIAVKGADGQAVAAGSAELLAYMYDRSLDIFAPHFPPNPLSLYPTWTAVVTPHDSLGSQSGSVLVEGGFARVPSGPALLPDRLRFDDGYGIGGPGLRGRSAGVVGELAEAMMDRSAPMPATAPAFQRTELAAEMGKASVREKKAESPAELEMDRQVRQESVPAVEMRSNFAETAFWEPHLLTGADGTATLEFTVPDSVTSWNVWVHALTRDLQAGVLRKEAKSVKDLMVRPYLPRFLREGDEAEIKVVVNNASAAPMTGRLDFQIEDPVTGRSLLADFGLPASPRPFSVEPHVGTTLTFPVKTPRRVGTAAFKVSAVAGDWSDGELRPLPLLPGRMHLAQSRFVALKGASTRTMTFADLAQDDDPTRVQEQMVVTLDAQLFYGVLQALPYLVDYPYECSEQTLNRFLSTGILTSLYGQYPAVGRMARELSQRETRLETWDEADANRKMALEETPWLQQAQGGPDVGLPLLKVLDPRIAAAQRDAALAKLQRSQTASGAFPWWAGGPPSPYMTLYVLYGFGKGLEFQVEAPKEVVQRAWGYMHQHYVDEVVRDLMARDVGWEEVTFINYVLGMYLDASWTGGVFGEADRQQMADFSFRHWREHSPYLKGQLALTLHRLQRAADAKQVWDSVMDSSKTDPELGTYWAPEDRAWLWYNDTVETQAFALRTLHELDPKDTRSDGLVQWLFLNKKLNHWKSTRATAEVVYALAHYLRGIGALGAREEATVSVGGQKTTFTFEPDQYAGKRNQVVLPGDRLVPKTAATITVEKSTPGFMFASATWHFSTERLPEEDRGDLLAVSRRYFRREQKGTEWVLTPLAEGATLSVGDQVEVQLSIRAQHAAEYVHLRDPRAAGLEPENAVSRHKWDLGLVRYEEVRDSGTNFFFERLPAGEYTLKYRLRANLAGAFKVSPATLQSMYAPEFTAYSTGAVVKVSGGAPATGVREPAS